MKKLLIFSTLLLIFGGASWGVFAWLWPLYLKTYPLPIDIATFRLRFPLYNDVEGDTLATTLHDNFFSRISQERFHRHFIPPELDKPEYMQTKPIVLPPQKGRIIHARVDYLVAGGSAKGDFWIWDLSRKGGRSLLTAPPPPWFKDAGIVSLAGAGVGALFWLSYILIGILGWFARLRLWRFLWVKRQGLIGLVGIWVIVLMCLFPPWTKTYRLPSSNIKATMPIGYRFLLHLPEANRLSGVSIDFPRLGLQCGIVFLVTGALYYTLSTTQKRKKPTYTGKI